MRFGMIHRNTYVNAPSTLEPTFETRKRPGLFFAGQMSGVEGYVESAASGLLAGIGAAFRARGDEPVAFPEDTALGALGRYIARSDPSHYQPTNIAFGLLPELPQRVRDKARRRLAMSERALASLAAFSARAGRARGRAVAAARRLAGLTCRRRSPRSSATSTASATRRRTRCAPTARTSTQFAAPCARGARPRRPARGRRPPPDPRLPGPPPPRRASRPRPRRASWPACAPSSATSAARASWSAIRRGRSSRRGWRGASPPTWTSGRSRSSSRCPATARPRCAPAPSSSCSTPPASAAPSSSASTCAEVDRQARMIRVLGKGRKERVVPFGTRAGAALDAYLRRPARGAPHVRRPVS